VRRTQGVKIPEDAEQPLDFEKFKHEIDTRGGYIETLALSIKDFEEELDQALLMDERYRKVFIKKVARKLSCAGGIQSKIACYKLSYYYHQKEIKRIMHYKSSILRGLMDGRKLKRNFLKSEHS
jgi:hypothetical protein